MGSILRSTVAVIAIAVGGAVYLSQKSSAPPPAASSSAAPRAATAAAPAAPRPAQAPRAAGGAVTLQPDANGHYLTQVEINGRRTPVLVDTGASSVVLSSEEAQRLGVYPIPGQFVMANTANGQVRMEKTSIPEIRLDTIAVRDVSAVIAPKGALQGAGLLGMTFLTRLRGFQSREGQLILTP